jgi:acetyltransferase-like isoleucine patch superfamily enzyme
MQQTEERQMSSFYTEIELEKMGFKSLGKNVLISRFAHFYSPEKITIGNNVRIDDFCIFSGIITIGSYIHISAYNAIYGKFGVEMENYSGLSPRCLIFSATDDFSGEHLIGPMVDEKYTNVSGGKVKIEKYVQLGASCVVLPNVTISEGAAVGAMSLVHRSLEPWKIYAGIPAKFLKDRSKEMLNVVS